MHLLFLILDQNIFGVFLMLKSNFGRVITNKLLGTNLKC